MIIERQIMYWKSNADSDMEAAEIMFEAGKYDWSLYIGHLVLEKLLKGIYVKLMNESPPNTHLLHVLARESGMYLPSELLDLLKSISAFHEEVQNPDASFEFRKVCNHEFAQQYFDAIKALYKLLATKLTSYSRN